MRFVGLVVICTLGTVQGLCSNNLQGIESNGVCCSESCGSCGGVGCSRREGGEESCCRGMIEDSGVLCSVSGMAPCIVDVEVEESFCDNEIPGIQGDGVCCSRVCGTCGGSGCSRRPGGAEECCRSTILVSETSCAVSGSAPCISTEVEETFCDDGIPGIQGDGICCSRQCGTCGGSGCSRRPGGAEECCRSTILETATSCDLSGSAPCVSLDVEETFCDDGTPGIQGDGVCCSGQCGSCGGSGCGSRPGGAEECCRSTIIETGTACGLSGSAPCISPEVEESFCDEGIPGIQASGVCCSRQCGACGGAGCSDLPGGAAECCVDIIVENGTPCSGNVAPCVFIDDPCDPNPCLNGGSCSLDPGGGHVCSCALNFGGMQCQIDTTSLAGFFIDVEFLGEDADWTDSRRNIFLAAARRWEGVVTHQPCGGDVGFPDGRLLISAELVEIDGPGSTAGSASPLTLRSGCPTISTTGEMVFDTADIGAIEADNILDALVQHEMGHVIGVGTLWGDCSTCRSDGDPTWRCPQTIEAYNDLLGNPTGTEAEIIETNFGGGTRCGHWDENDIFGDELMTGILERTAMPLSKVTAASLDDTGYVVDPSQVDDYTLPARRPAAAAFDPAGAIVLDETAVKNVIQIVGEYGEVVEIESVTMTFKL